MSYHLGDKPYVNYWLPTPYGDGPERFENFLRKENLDRPEREGGVCLAYAHMGSSGLS